MRLSYFINRLLLLLPSLFVISIIAFVISINAPGDPVDRILTSKGDEPQTNVFIKSEQYQQLRKQLGLDLPTFYFSVRSLSSPDTIHRIANKQQRIWLLSLSDHYGTWQEVTDLYLSITNSLVFYANDIGTQQQLLQLLNSSPKTLEQQIDRLNKNQSSLLAISTAYENLKKNASGWKTYIPITVINYPNQYHNWLFGNGKSKGAIRGDFGISTVNHQPVGERIKKRIGWTLFFSLTSLLLAYLISIPIGVKAASKAGGRFDKVTSNVLFLMYAMPPFWLAVLLLMLFANPDVLNWFPVSGVQPVSGFDGDVGWWNKIKSSLPYLVLPLIAYTYLSVAYIARLLRDVMIDILKQDYITTARAKGLKETVVLYRHAFRNALLPLITVFSNVFPALLGGSVILETIFSIPGMGYETVMAVQNFDYPMVVAIFTISGVLAVIGYLIADVLYAIADPRIQY